MLEILDYPDHVIRTYHVTKIGQPTERTIKQFHYTNWPDHGVPSDASALFSLIKKVNRWRASCGEKCPLVSCSCLSHLFSIAWANFLRANPHGKFVLHGQIFSKKHTGVIKTKRCSSLREHFSPLWSEPWCFFFSVYFNLIQCAQRLRMYSCEKMIKFSSRKCKFLF